jgi:hypothetical protein
VDEVIGAVRDAAFAAVTERVVLSRLNLDLKLQV